MQGSIPAAVLVVALALLAAALPTADAAQRSAAPLRQQEPSGLLEQDEATEVARALDEAELEIGRTIHVDVVERNGRRVSTDWFAPVSKEGVGSAAEVPMPVFAGDVNAPDGIVVLVDPFEGAGSFVQAPGLTDRDERYLSKSMTYEFHRGSYDDGLIAVAYVLENRFANPRSSPHPSDAPHRQAATERAFSGVAVALFAGGTAVVILLLAYFLKAECYRGPHGPDKGVAFVAARRDTEALLSALAPRVMLLAEKERAVIARLRNPGEGTMPNGPDGRRKAEVLLRQAVSGAFWEDFVRAISLAEEDPEEGLPELRRLATGAEAALGKLGEAEEAMGDCRAGYEGSGGDKEHLTRRDENDG